LRSLRQRGYERCKDSRFSEEQIFEICRSKEAGATTAEVCRKHEISGPLLQIQDEVRDLAVPDAKRLKAPEVENATSAYVDVIGSGSSSPRLVLPATIIPIMTVTVAVVVVAWINVIVVAWINVIGVIAWVAIGITVARLFIRIVSVEIIGRVFAIIVSIATAPVRRFDNRVAVCRQFKLARRDGDRLSCGGQGPESQRQATDGCTEPTLDFHGLSSLVGSDA
jgi:putative transposase